jgi:curved DNA-binding protein CbpA
MHELINKIEQLYSELTEMDYYDLLEIESDASSSDIKRSYYRLARDLHPDKHRGLPEDVHAKLSEIFSHMNDAYNTLGDPEKRNEYDRSPSKVRREMTSSIDLAQEKFAEGKVAFKKKNYEEAVELFGAAAYTEDSVADYHYYLGLALLKQDRLKDAENSLRRAHLIDTDNDEILVELGHIYLKLGFNLRAKGNFEKALKLNPDNQQAQDGIALSEQT